MPALAEELVARGLDLWLEIEDEAESDETLELLMRWLAGEQLTERADEHELRLNAAEDALELMGDDVPSLHRYHARAILALPAGNPRRHVAEAIAELRDHLETTRDDPDERIRTISALLDAGAGDEALLDEGDELTAEADPYGAGEFRLAAEGYTAGRHIDARDAGDEAEAARWAERHGEYVDADDSEGLGALASRASRLDMAQEWPEAADLYRTVVEGSDVAWPEVQEMAVREGELRLMLGQLDRAATALETVIGHAEARYLTALGEADVKDASDRLHRLADALAATQARRGDWNGVLRACDRPRGLRGRYQAALRADAAGRELLQLERELDAALRGAGADEEDGVSASARLLERFRQVRPRLDPARLTSPTIAETAAVLEEGEGFAALGYHFTGTVGVFVAPGDAEPPDRTARARGLRNTRVARAVRRRGRRRLAAAADRARQRHRSRSEPVRAARRRGRRRRRLAPAAARRRGRHAADALARLDAAPHPVGRAPEPGRDRRGDRGQRVRGRARPARAVEVAAPRPGRRQPDARPARVGRRLPPDRRPPGAPPATR